MRFSYCVFFKGPPGTPLRITEADIQAVTQVVEALTGLTKAHLYRPATAQDRYNDDGPSPCFGFQLYFDAFEALEAAIAADGTLQALADPAALPSLAGATATQQAMLTRRFPVMSPAPLSPTACSYVVHYPGPAADFNAWISHYIAHHPPIMARFPGCREVEILTRTDWMDAMPWRRVHHMQRNRVMFDSPEALTAALHSPVREEMRADFARFPPYEGGNYHFPFTTTVVRPGV